MESYTRRSKIDRDYHHQCTLMSMDNGGRNLECRRHIICNGRFFAIEWRCIFDSIYGIRNEKVPVGRAVVLCSFVLIIYWQHHAGIGQRHQEIRQVLPPTKNKVYYLKHCRFQRHIRQTHQVDSCQCETHVSKEKEQVFIR